MRFNEILEGSRADVSLRIFGPNLDQLIEYIDKASEIVKKIEGVDEAEMDSLTALKKSPMMDITLNYKSMARYGVSLQSVNAALEMSMGGIQLGNFYEDDRRFPVIMHLDELYRNKESEIQRIPVGLSGGGTVPLKNVAEFSEKDHVTTIARSFGKRYAALSIFLKNRDVQSFVNEAKLKIDSELKIKPEYSLEWGGQFKNLEHARLRLLLIVPITLLLIFIILLRNFSNVSLTLLVYSSIPFAVTGGILSLFLRGIPFSISAGIGFIALLGIAILNSMVLVDFINQLRESGLSVKEAVVKGASQRLRPIVMTALVAGLGFLPMAINTGMGAEVQRPLATVVIGGLITSMILTLVLLPTLYIWLEDRKT
jgi:cobalt-zinc-cadmium resistance protein CzcA